MVFVLGIADIISALSLFLVTFSISLPFLLVFIFALYLLIKAYVLRSFTFGFAIDLIAGIFLILAFFLIPSKWSLFASASLAIKGFRNIVLI